MEQKEKYRSEKNIQKENNFIKRIDEKSITWYNLIK